MNQYFKSFLADRAISEEKYKAMSDENQVKLIEAFEKNNSQGELSIHSVFG